MKNAKVELQNRLNGTAKIKCASINRDDYGYKLLLNYTDNDLADFYNSLDFEYDNGFGGQELYGTVWLDDDSWLSRGEYDGSEWWNHNILPTIPDELK